MCASTRCRWRLSVASTLSSVVTRRPRVLLCSSKLFHLTYQVKSALHISFLPFPRRYDHRTSFGAASDFFSQGRMMSRLMISRLSLRAAKRWSSTVRPSMDQSDAHEIPRPERPANEPRDILLKRLEYQVRKRGKPAMLIIDHIRTLIHLYRNTRD